MSIKIYTSDQMRDWDHYTIQNEPISSLDLMERAASLATKSILGRNVFDSVAIFCGPGNNGGDGLVIARILAEVGRDVTVYQLSFGEQSADFKANLKKLPKAVNQIELTESQHDLKLSADLIIDCIFGSGLNRSIEGWIGNVIIGINKTGIRTIAIDLPSGLFSHGNDKNDSFPAVIEADETLTFMAPKMPFFYPTFAGFVGDFRIINIGLHPDFEAEPLATYTTKEDIQIRSRKKFAHKGVHGYLSIIAGLENMSGAAILAAQAALRSGAGYTAVLSSDETRLALHSRLAEVLWQSVNDEQIPSKSTAIVIGPGLGMSEMASKLLSLSFNANLPLLIDADAINIIANEASLIKSIPEQSILTPHIGELKRLIGIHRTDEDLLAAQMQFSKTQKVFVIQKGPYSKMTTPDGRLIVNSTGNAGMAVAGMGDALSGIIGALLAQGYSAEEAGTYGMYIHGAAGDLQAKNKGEIGMTVTDLIEQIPTIMNQLPTT